MVWRFYGRIEWSKPFDEWDPEQIEPWHVERLTEQKVFIRSYLDPDNPPSKSFVLARQRLQRYGWAYCHPISNGPGATHGAGFLVRRPEAYRRKTVGFLLQGEAKAVLGLKPDATEADARAAYIALVKQHHPDKGGDPALFARVQEAYANIGKVPSLAEILEFARR